MIAAQSALPWATADASMPGTVEVTAGNVVVTAGRVVVTAGRVVVTAGRVVVIAARVNVVLQEAGQAKPQPRSAVLVGLHQPNVELLTLWRWRNRWAYRHAHGGRRVGGPSNDHRYPLSQVNTGHVHVLLAILTHQITSLAPHAATPDPIRTPLVNTARVKRCPMCMMKEMDQYHHEIRCVVKRWQWQ